MRLEVIIAICTAASTILAAVAVLVAIYAQQQTQEMQRDLQRPVLTVVEEKAMIKFTPERWVNFDLPIVGSNPNTLQLLTLRNVGVGAAVNVHGVIFGPYEESPRSKEKRLTAIVWKILPAQQESEVEFRIGQTVMDGKCKMRSRFKFKGYTLSAPKAPQPSEQHRLDLTPIVARLTLTYQDIYGRNHASIYEVSDQGGWKPVAFLKNVQMDVKKLDMQARQKSYQH